MCKEGQLAGGTDQATLPSQADGGDGAPRSWAGSRRPQLSEDAANYIRNMITTGRLSPGEPVRADAIGEDLGISGTPVREALQALRVEGFLDLMPRKGFVVAPLTGKDIRDIFTAHAMLSGELAYRAARVATADDIAELEVLHGDVLTAASATDMALLEAKNHAFHRKLNLLADARKIAWALGLVTRYTPALFYASIEGWPEATVEDHTKILDTVRSHDAKRARTSMQAHIVNAGELLAQHYDARAAMSRGTAVR